MLGILSGNEVSGEVSLIWGIERERWKGDWEGEGRRVGVEEGRRRIDEWD